MGHILKIIIYFYQGTQPTLLKKLYNSYSTRWVDCPLPCKLSFELFRSRTGLVKKKFNAKQSKAKKISAYEEDFIDAK